jgi:hypothetical protein
VIPVVFLPRLSGSPVHAGRMVGLDAYGDEQYRPLCNDRPRAFAYPARDPITCRGCLAAAQVQLTLDPRRSQ